MKYSFTKSTVLAAVLFLSARLGAQVTNEIQDPNVGNNVVTYDTLDFYIAPNTLHQYHVDAHNVGSSQKDYKVSKQDIVMAGSAYTYFCVFHNGDGGDLQSHCYSPGVDNPGDVYRTQPGEHNQFICDFWSGTTFGTSMVKYRIFDANSLGDTAWFILRYNVSPAGVATLAAGNLQLSEAYPNPSNGVVKFSYNIGENATASMHMYDIEGRIVRTETIARAEGELTLDLSELPAGVYSCMLQSSDGFVVTRRIVVAE